ncbi:MAG: IS1 family transposase [Thermoprotei archaeon]
MVDIDEMWTYVRRRLKDCWLWIWTYLTVNKSTIKIIADCWFWIWTAVVDGKDLVFNVGGRGLEDFVELFSRLPNASVYRTDGYAVYGVLPRGKHLISGRVNVNESRHSVLRDCLARLRRCTKAYTKSVELLKYSLALVTLHKGWCGATLP